MYVVAKKDFRYNKDEIRRGQIFRLSGFRNDGAMLKHGTVRPLEEQPDTAKDLNQYPRCGECGRHFVNPVDRDRCGEIHELPAMQLRDRRHDAARRRVTRSA